MHSHVMLHFSQLSELVLLRVHVNVNAFAPHDVFIMIFECINLDYRLEVLLTYDASFLKVGKFHISYNTNPDFKILILNCHKQCNPY